MSRLS